MKGACDHCGGGLNIHRDDAFVAWCEQCVKDDNALLNAVGLTDAAGMPMLWPPLNGEICVSFMENIHKLKAIPPKGSKPALTVEVAETKTMELSQPYQPKLEPAFDFDKYNSTIPGWGHGYR
jgi:hypothetical protein